jgi:hypothetical protein
MNATSFVEGRGSSMVDQKFPQPFCALSQSRNSLTAPVASAIEVSAAPPPPSCS